MAKIGEGNAGGVLGARALVVEDNEINRLVAEGLLSRWGAEVVMAEDGLEAVEIFASEGGFDVVLMDIRMPELDGYEAAKKIRELPGGSEVPIIAMSADVMDGVEKRCLDAGINGVVAKPVNVSELRSALRRHIRLDKEKAVVDGGHGAESSAFRDIHSIAGLDVETALNRMGGDEDAYVDVLAKFVSHNSSLVADIRSCLEKGMVEEAGNLAHTFKGVAGNIGADGLFERTSNICNFLRQGDIRSAVDLLEDLDQALSGLLDELRGVSHLTSPSKPSHNGKQLRRGIRELANLLRDNDFEAVDRLKDLRGDFEKAGVYGELLELVGNYDYEKAIEVLRRVAKNWYNVDI